MEEQQSNSQNLSPLATPTSQPQMQTNQISQKSFESSQQPQTEPADYSLHSTARLNDQFNRPIRKMDQVQIIRPYPDRPDFEVEVMNDFECPANKFHNLINLMKQKKHLERCKQLKSFRIFYICKYFDGHMFHKETRRKEHEARCGKRPLNPTGLGSFFSREVPNPGFDPQFAPKIIEKSIQGHRFYLENKERLREEEKIIREFKKEERNEKLRKIQENRMYWYISFEDIFAENYPIKTFSLGKETKVSFEFYSIGIKKQKKHELFQLSGTLHSSFNISKKNQLSAKPDLKAFLMSGKIHERITDCLAYKYQSELNYNQFRNVVNSMKEGLVLSQIDKIKQCKEQLLICHKDVVASHVSVDFCKEECELLVISQDFENKPLKESCFVKMNPIIYKSQKLASLQNQQIMKLKEQIDHQISTINTLRDQNKLEKEDLERYILQTADKEDKINEVNEYLEGKDLEEIQIENENELKRKSILKDKFQSIPSGQQVISEVDEEITKQKIQKLFLQAQDARQEVSQLNAHKKQLEKELEKLDQSLYTYNLRMEIIKEQREKAKISLEHQKGSFMIVKNELKDAMLNEKMKNQGRTEPKSQKKEPSFEEKYDPPQFICVMCMSNKRNIVFMPCNHVLLCQVCVSLMERIGLARCLGCDQVVQGTRKLLYSEISPVSISSAGNKKMLGKNKRTEIIYEDSEEDDDNY